MKSLEFRIRKLHVNTDADKRLQKRQPSRVYVNEEALIELTGTNDGGRAVCLEKVSASPDEPPIRREATLWKAPERLDKTVTQMYDVFRDAGNYKLGEQVRITSLGGPLPDADEVVIEQAPAPDGTAPEPPAPEDIPHWEFILAGRLSQIEHVYAGLVFKNLFVRGPERTFVVASVNSRSTGNARYLDRKTTVRLATTTAAGNQVGRGLPSRKLEVTGIRGLDTQIAQLNRFLSRFTGDAPFTEALPYSGIVIHGGHGTGKTMLLNNIAKTGWGTVLRIQYKDKLSEIQETFQRARLQQPSIVLIDQLERLIDKERSNRAAVILALCEALDALAADTAAKGEMCQVAVVVTCLDYTTDVPEDLKKPGRLTTESYLPMPDVLGRREILAALRLGVAPDQEEELLRSLSERTHAYNGDDLCRLVAQGRWIGYDRYREASASPSESGMPTPASNDDQQGENETGQPPAKLYYLPSDYHEALRLVRPSAMQDINLKPPPIRWDDIGGQDSVKLSLRRAVKLSTEPPNSLSRYFESPPKGFLLYGPPGCSKTMAAQAMATESGLNFFAVKGAELLNMYVGESERAVRRLFQRAREVSPSMIFFDEIDSIAGQRSGFSHSSSSSSSGGGSGVNVLTTLLNEMDGFEALHGVVVLAATNRPQALDPALLRPGRFDELIYVSPPDEAARRAIFAGFVAPRKDNIHDDVDIDSLAEDTDGYSGAEIKAICREAGLSAYDRHWVGGEPAIMMRDFKSAIKNQRRRITREMLAGYEEWEKQFRKAK